MSAIRSREAVCVKAQMSSSCTGSGGQAEHNNNTKISHVDNFVAGTRAATDEEDAFLYAKFLSILQVNFYNPLIKHSVNKIC